MFTDKTLGSLDRFDDAPDGGQHGRPTSMGRRTFVRLAGVGGVGLAGGMLGASAGGGVPGRADGIVINALGGITNPNLRLREDAPSGPIQGTPDGLDPRALRDVVASDTTAINVTLGYVAGLMDPFEHSVADIARWNGLIRAHSDVLLKVESAADIERAKREGRVGIIPGFQNAAMLGDDADRARIFAGLGVKVIQLTYNVPNALGSGSMDPANGGLTAFGREAVEALDDARVLIDLSHSGEQTCLDATAVAGGPIAITHTGCRALSDLPRNKTDTELRRVAERGGGVGIYFMPFLKEDGFPDAMDVVRHIEHAVNVCGEDHVGIGTDGGTTAVDDLEAYRGVIAREVEARRAAGISARGEKPGVVPFVPDLQGPDQFRTLAGMLSERGHSAARIEKILGLNFLRLMREVWGG